jgi:Peptidase A4 family
MKRLIHIATVVPAAAAIALTAGAASAASNSQQAAGHGDFAGYQTATDGSNLVTIHSVAARWTQPKATPRNFHNAYSEALVGLNTINGTGAGVQQAMPQVGTEANSIGGKPQYYAWYTPPKGGAGCAVDGDCTQVRFSNVVKPGDHMSASITVTGSDHDRFTIKLTDSRSRRHRRPLRWTRTVRFTESFASYPELATVGVGAPQNSEEAVLLADFGTVKFTSAQVNGVVIGGYPDTVLAQYNDYASANGGSRPLATSSAITGNGGTFTATWKRSE